MSHGSLHQSSGVTHSVTPKIYNPEITCMCSTSGEEEQENKL